MITRFRIQLKSEATCPHCWHRFKPADAKWISTSMGLDDDVKLGAGFARRFRPSRFDVDGNALDVGMGICRDLACPECHLVVPRSLFEAKTLFMSILGSPSCGKSYFLASMTWRLRSLLPRRFALTFGDADPEFNRHLIQYEEQQFMNPERDDLVALAKTEEQGDLYDEVRNGNDIVRYPRPMLFMIRPLAKHPYHELARKTARVLCLYDNAGESFDPGKDTPDNPVTRHLARSQILLFLFDPTQDPRFRAACAGKTHDPQIVEATVTSRQETVLHEAIRRIRRYRGLRETAKHNRPLLVVVTKFDAWQRLLGADFRLPNIAHASASDDIATVKTAEVEKLSDQVRDLLWEYSPEIVSAAEGFSDWVRFIPVSATGRAPERDPLQGRLGFRPRDIDPQWVEVPLVYSLAKWSDCLIGKQNSPLKPPPTDVQMLQGTDVTA